MNHNLAALTAATAFTWLGMVVGISLLETPLRFRALRADVEQDAEATRLGLGIGRLVFRALNTAEAVLAAVIVVTSAWRPGAAGSGSGPAGSAASSLGHDLTSHHVA
ncbi:MULTISPECIES: hypothetical protein [Streptomyces violaceusniger group]|uniref:DUF4149 domain-containing protein n=2 Tax=Streptomyces rhizosphaericus TaxID=114699 RepID=A0ABN1RX00_9ACTN